MYTNPVAQSKETISKMLENAFAKCGFELPDGAIEVSPTKDASHGDFASNVAMKASKKLGKNPREIAASLCESLELEGSHVSKVEIAGPGFINFFLSDKYYSDVVKAAVTEGADYGKNDTGAGKKVMVEFVSANPTGPMHMGNARGGIVGDTLSTVLSYSGYDVTREFYVNDAGNQVDILGKCLSVRYIQHFRGEDAAHFPEDGYHGNDVKVIASDYAAEHGDNLLEENAEVMAKELVTYALNRNIAKMQSDLKKYKIVYDNWFYESTLHISGFVADTVELLRQKGALYEKEGALWFKATDFGCDKDEVLVKANGFYTYYAVDIAYHRNKFETRGFDMVIDVLGADHHGHTLRFPAVLDALGIDKSKLRFVLIQLVRLMQGGEVVRMSKRTGKVISLADLLDEIPVDAARFFFDYKVADSAMDFDLDLAVKQNSENPVYYVQYAHARICSIIKNLEAEGVKAKDISDVDLSLLCENEERDLIKLIASFPDEILTAAETLEPTRISRYCTAVGASFHKFYGACYVRNENEALMQARLALCLAAKQVIKNSLDIINIDAPEKM